MYKVFRSVPGMSHGGYNSRCFTEIIGGSIFLQHLCSEVFNMYYAMAALDVSVLPRITISRF